MDKDLKRCNDIARTRRFLAHPITNRNMMHVGLPDVERLARKLERRKASLADLCQLYRASSRLPMMIEAFRDHEGPHADILNSRCAFDGVVRLLGTIGAPC